MKYSKIYHFQSKTIKILDIIIEKSLNWILFKNIINQFIDLKNDLLILFKNIFMYYSLAIDGARVLLHSSPAAIFASSHSSFPTLLPEKQRAVFGFPKRQSWLLHEKLKLSLLKSKEGTLIFWKKSWQRTMWWWKYKK